MKNKIAPEIKGGEKMNKPIYCFSLNYRTGEITRKEIVNYEKSTRYKFDYSFMTKVNGQLAQYGFREENMDKVHNLRIYSWEDNFDKAVDLFIEYLMNERRKASETYDRIANLIINVDKRYNGVTDKM